MVHGRIHKCGWRIALLSSTHIYRESEMQHSEGKRMNSQPIHYFRLVTHTTMKKIFAAILLVSAFGFTSSSSDYVYICVSKTAEKYHFTEDCRGIKKCTHTIEKVTITQAKGKGYSLCGFEK